MEYSKITGMMRNVLLAAVNAKYIHSNLAVYSLQRYAGQRIPGGMDRIGIAEYTINQQAETILADLFRRAPEVLCFSCYIWNMDVVARLLPEVKKVLPETQIWLGGPEVSYGAAAVLVKYPCVSGVMRGEGEETFAELAQAWAQGEQPDLQGIRGVTYRESDGRIRENPWREPVELDSIPFVYTDMAQFRNRILYYESSRGCPFSCSYCLSSIDKKLRFRSPALVKEELRFFLEQETAQVKFVDRTFNCRRDHAMEIWRFIKEHDNGVTNFHFEISADLLDEEELALLRSMRPGLVQLEIGVQSTNPETIRKIRRSMDLAKLERAVRRIREGANIHQHLDLIAGLPGEDLESFGRSFDRVYAMRPDQLQLGFLKVLKGSRMEEEKEEYGLVCRDTPPYEVLFTRWLSYADLLVLKGVEEMTEIYYNSGQFKHALLFLEKYFPSPFALYRQLAACYEEKGLQGVQHARPARYEFLLAFGEIVCPGEQEALREALIFDYYLRENAKSRPAFAGEPQADPEWVRRFYEEEASARRYLKGYEGMDRNQLRRMTHLEYFPLSARYVLFDYRKRDPLTNDGTAIHIEKRK